MVMVATGGCKYIRFLPTGPPHHTTLPYSKRVSKKGSNTPRLPVVVLGAYARIQPQLNLTSAVHLRVTVNPTAAQNAVLHSVLKMTTNKTVSRSVSLLDDAHGSRNHSRAHFL